MLIKKYFLVLGFFFISGIAALYGVAPDWFARTFFGMSLNWCHASFAHSDVPTLAGE